MSYPTQNDKLIPMFLLASSPERLMQLMFANNAVNSKQYNYQTPVRDELGWIVWYYGIIGTDVAIKEEDLEKLPTDIGLIDVRASNNAEELNDSNS